VLPGKCLPGRGQCKKRQLVGTVVYPPRDVWYGMHILEDSLGTYVDRRAKQPEEVPCMCSACALACGVDEKLSAA
jgi:hypothetical protein